MKQQDLISSNKNRLKKLKKLQEKIDGHPGKIAHTEWNNLKRVYGGIYLPNREELIKTLLAPSKIGDLAVELIQNVRPPVVRERYVNHLIRLIHNYVASLTTLIDHSRRLISHENPQFKNKYDEKKQKIAATAEHHLITDIRNYMVHYRIPPLAWTMSINDKDGKESCDFYLDVEALLDWEGWSAESKQLLGASKPKLDLIKLIKNHGKTIDEFNNWLLSQFTKFHGKDIDTVNKLIKKWNLVLSGKD